MIDELAAVLKHLPCRCSNDPELDELRRREAARAVLAAMREPTEAIIEAGGYQVPGERMDGDAACRVWHTMIDEAMK